MVCPNQLQILQPTLDGAPCRRVIYSLDNVQKRTYTHKTYQEAGRTHRRCFPGLRQYKSGVMQQACRRGQLCRGEGSNRSPNSSDQTSLYHITPPTSALGLKGTSAGVLTTSAYRQERTSRLTCGTSVFAANNGLDPIHSITSSAVQSVVGIGRSDRPGGLEVDDRRFYQPAGRGRSRPGTLEYAADEHA